MNLSWILNRARKAAEAAGAQAEADEKAARIAKETARAAKTKLKFARKLAKLARRAAKSARRKAAESFDTLERAREKLKELEKRAARDNPRPKPSRTRHRAKAVRNSSAKRSSAPAKPVAVLRSRVQTKRRGAARKQPVSPAPAARKARSPRRPNKTHRPIIATPGEAALRTQTMAGSSVPTPAPGAGGQAETQTDSTGRAAGVGPDVPVM
jgi:colicin import membrane protein